MRKNNTHVAAAASSATIMDIHMPSIPHSRGRIRTAAAWNSSVLKNEINADVSPSFNDVKKDEPKIAVPANRKEKE